MGRHGGTRIAVAAVTGVVVAALSFSPLSAANVATIKGLTSPTYIPLPASARVDAGIIFSPIGRSLTRSHLLSPRQALTHAAPFYEKTPGARVVSVSLGNFVDSFAIVHDWIGTTSKYPAPRAVYAITLAGVTIYSTGPTCTCNRVRSNGSEVLLESATTGKVISTYVF